MKILTSRELCRTFKNAMRRYNEYHWAVAWATIGHETASLLEKNKEKIERLAIGTHFHQTDPKFIETYIEHPNVRFCLGNDGLKGIYHPKLYVFYNNTSDWEVIIGSANFTKFAFNDNVEYATRATASDTSEIDIIELLTEVDTHWRNAGRFNQESLENYKAKHKENQKRIALTTGGYSEVQRTKSIYEIGTLNKSWDSYYSSIREIDTKFFDERITMLRHVKAIWVKTPTFSQLTLEDRQKISGVFPEDKIKWKLFGSMKGAGYFKQAVNNAERNLIHSLDEIPLVGPVRKDHYNNFVDKLRLSLSRKREYDGVAVATRLLCMRRPDYFNCIDGENKNSMAAAIGIKKSNIHLDTYWDIIIEPLLDTPWWNSERPAGEETEQTAWESRVALLDSLFYEGKQAES